jgi:Zn ribbon nucleic-acid-binding protein
MPHSKPKADERFATLDDPKGLVPKESPAFGCTPPNCLLGDRMTKWYGFPNAECPRCGFATIDIRVAEARRPGFDFRAKGLSEH